MMLTSCLILFFLTSAICQERTSVLELFPEYRSLKTKIEALENAQKGTNWKLRNQEQKLQDHVRQNEQNLRQQNAKSFIGFSAYMSQTYAKYHSTHWVYGSILVFDKTVTNPNTVYSTSTGKFTAPSSGMYAFTWTICVDSRPKDNPHTNDYGEFGTALVIDGSVRGRVHADTEKENDDECSTGFVIASVVRQAFLRVFYSHQGAMLSQDDRTHTSFSGWKLN